jgi:hypothetical protein
MDGAVALQRLYVIQGDPKLPALGADFILCYTTSCPHHASLTGFACAPLHNSH